MTLNLGQIVASEANQANLVMLQRRRKGYCCVMPDKTDENCMATVQDALPPL